ncbi:hypothetical protein Tco_0622285 [Tanacetum coccineum]
MVKMVPHEAFACRCAEGDVVLRQSYKPESYGKLYYACPKSKVRIYKKSQENRQKNGQAWTRERKSEQKPEAMIEVLKSSAQHSSVNEVFSLNLSEEDIEPQPNSPLQEIIILDPDDQPMWESAKIVAPTPNSVIVRPNVDDNFVINSTHVKMIWENKFDGYLRADPHDHIREFLTICDMFKYGETQSEAVKILMFSYSLCDEAKM